ncbi:MAG: type III glutamate--ammonia ligase [Acidimicrobiia bacterium]|nr:type III glutamate--ammonia ligase [Acidimicrobiia bacterium]
MPTDDLVDTLRAHIEATDVEFVMAMFVDLHGKPCAKLIPAGEVEVLAGAAGFAGFAAGPLGQTPADPDMVAIPDPDSFTAVPWQEGLAVVMCDLTVEGEPWPYAPRVILRRQLDRLARHDLHLKCGVEAEYSLVVREPDGRLRVADERDRSALPCYDARGLVRMYDHLTDVSRHLNTLGFGNYANDHEDGNGQFEQNFTYDDAMVTADRLVLFRFMLHVLAERAGMEATFMPKPFSAVTGNGLHVHTSLWSPTDEPLFEPGPDDRYELGLSEMGYQFVAGMLRHARAMTAITCPTVNSYKRLGGATPTSGATWAPSLVAYGGNNRTHLLRVPDAGRVEYRGVDGAANPYLTFTALAAAGLDGIENHLDPGVPNHDNLFDADPDDLRARGVHPLPPTLLHAADLLVDDDVLRAAFGKGPAGEYVDYFADVKRQEFLEWHAQVTDWEIDRYLTLV